MKKLNQLNVATAIISGKTAIIGEVISEVIRTGFFSEDILICSKGTVNGCDFKIQGLQSEVNKVISTIRPYPGSGPVEVGHSYIGRHTGKNAVAVYVSDHYIVSRYDNGLEYGCTTKQFRSQFRSSFEERAFRSFHEDLHHYRGRLPDALIDACMSEAKKFK